MAHIIIKIKDYYLEWSTICDAPISYGTTSLEEFKEEYLLDNPSISLEEFNKKIERVNKYGHSSLPVDESYTIEEFIACNRAGPNEDTLTFEELYKAYCLHEPIRDNWIPE